DGLPVDQLCRHAFSVRRRRAVGHRLCGLLLAVGYWLLAIGYWLLAISRQLSAISPRLTAIGQRLPISTATVRGRPTAPPVIPRPTALPSPPCSPSPASRGRRGRGMRQPACQTPGNDVHRYRDRKGAPNRPNPRFRPSYST